jgi:hypothetical protein
MILDLSNASRGRAFEFVGGPFCGEKGNTLDYLNCTEDGNLTDYLDDMKAGYVEIRVGSRMIFTCDQGIG